MVDDSDTLVARIDAFLQRPVVSGDEVRRLLLDVRAALKKVSNHDSL